ncbi:hypothetical protein APUTEX25_002029 [Auxenochlorella protothecoides]|uniref:AAA+ ATPase domain-containing protein n=1 Tax=Auxenochlorella protothecoides TaxID=3075 RepID=A0A3M7KVA4_AUXPR|nr:hypothetical protein APUTEX25_002029 [Auxenochlorella protothecoides]|eukprot:RMZ54453.1 hypothetical protein APUTEX25_002029 [Auxenochlorella protothecoides]
MARTDYTRFSPQLTDSDGDHLLRSRNTMRGGRKPVATPNGKPSATRASGVLGALLQSVKSVGRRVTSRANNSAPGSQITPRRSSKRLARGSAPGGPDPQPLGTAIATRASSLRPRTVEQLAHGSVTRSGKRRTRSPPAERGGKGLAGAEATLPSAAKRRCRAVPLTARESVPAAGRVAETELSPFAEAARVEELGTRLTPAALTEGLLDLGESASPSTPPGVADGDGVAGQAAVQPIPTEPPPTTPTRASAAPSAEAQETPWRQGLLPCLDRLTSIGPKPSQSVRDSILKSPTPPRRATMAGAGPRIRGVPFPTCDDQAWWDPLDPAKVRAAKAALHASADATGMLPLCRERQAAAVTDWIRECLESGTGGSCYLSGPPGTGKTLTAQALLRGVHGEIAAGTFLSRPEEPRTAGPRPQPPALVSINCMRLSASGQVAGRILDGLAVASSGEHVASVSGKPLVYGGGDPLVLPSGTGRWTGEAALAELRRAVVSREDTVSQESAAGPLPHAARRQVSIVLLDELDGLLHGSRGEAMVEDLFALAHAPGSRLLILGIANTVDLVQQLLRPGAAFHRRNIFPRHEVFPAYSPSALTSLLTQRAERLPGPVFEPRVLELCARKMGNGCGDMRRALEAAAAALEACVQEARRDQGAAHRVTLRHMAAALSALTGGVGEGSAACAAMRALPPPQQLVLAALLGRAPGSGPPSGASSASSASGGSRSASGGSAASSASRPASGAGASLGGLHAAHAALCREVGLAPYALAELAAALAVLADQGLLALGPRRRGEAQQRVALKVPEVDVLNALRSLPVVGTVLQGRMAVGPSTSFSP